MHPQVVLVPKPPVTAFTIVLVMGQILHMLIRSVLREKRLGASLTLEARCPVVLVPHMLIASMLGTKGGGTGLACGPVVIIVHVVLALVLIPEGSCACLALVHLESRWSRR